MYGSEIYNDFKKDIYWIRDRIQEEAPFFPDSMKPLIEHYTKSRLIIIPTKPKSGSGRKYDYELGRPVPYAVYWFADAFGLRDKKVYRKLGLGLIYSALTTTIRDDIIDSESPPDPQCAKLLNYYNYKYLEVFEELFNKDSVFWYHLAKGFQETARYESWNLLFNNRLNVDPFSESFLEESSRYFTAVVMPTLTAIAILTDNESKISVASEFLRHFSMGWRIYDDFCDWKRDLKVDGFNHSSILLYILQYVQGETDLNEEIVYSMFLNPEFIGKSYGAILHFYEAAKSDVSGLNCKYLTKFMEEQISFHTKRRDNILSCADESKSEFLKQLDTILNM